MPKHEVSFELPTLDLGNVDAIFRIRKDGEQLGRIKISKGGLDYYPKNKKQPLSVSWTDLDELIRERHGK